MKYINQRYHCSLMQKISCDHSCYIKTNICNVVFIFIFIIVLFTIGLWPFSFNNKNNVYWLQSGYGVNIEENGIIYSGEFSTDLFDKLKTGSFFVIELIIEPKKSSTKELRYILTCSKSKMQNNFALAQWQQDLFFYLKTTKNAPGENINTIQIKDVFTSTINKHIIIIRNKDDVNFYIDNQLIKNDKIPGNFSNWNDGSIIRLGNDDSDQNSWEGNFYKFAIYKKASISEESIKFKKKDSILYYIFKRSEPVNVIKDISTFGAQHDLYIPTQFHEIGKSVLSFPDRYFLFSAGFIKDVFLNIIGFIPLGFFCAKMFTNIIESFLRVAIISLTIGVLVSLCIEILQIFIFSRSSSSFDLVTNAIGTYLGVLIIKKYFNKNNVVSNNS